MMLYAHVLAGGTQEVLKSYKDWYIAQSSLPNIPYGFVQIERRRRRRRRRRNGIYEGENLDVERSYTEGPLAAYVGDR
jgi:hypothetical protein